ncbi:hypothetical protein C0993_001458, partial [Termitomyces sp. T159_Od127]
MAVGGFGLLDACSDDSPEKVFGRIKVTSFRDVFAEESSEDGLIFLEVSKGVVNSGADELAA